MVAGFLLTPAAATPAEDAYIAARDAAITKVKAATDAEPKNPTGGDDDKVIALDTQELAGLERQLRAIVGSVAIKGLGGKSAINLDTPAMATKILACSTAWFMATSTPRPA